jgi:hypothetical protein
MSKWTRVSRRNKRRKTSKGKGKLIKVSAAEETSQIPQDTGKRKIMRVGTAGEKAEG